MRIFKTHYLKENQIFQLHGLPSHLIRKSYTGGHTDVYIPSHNLTNEIKMIYIVMILIY